jgi:hypothetical protein
VHAVQTLNPSDVVTEPAAQPVQAVVPVEEEYLPAGQLEQEVARPSGGLKVPTTHEAQKVWPAVDWAVPPGQSEQAAVPMLAENWPVGQEVHRAELCASKANHDRGELQSDS